MNPDLQIVSVANRRPEAWYYLYDQCFASAKRFGYDITVLGQKPGEYRGLGSKPKLLQRALKQGLITKKWLLFVDCFDLVFVRDPGLLTAIKVDEFNDADLVIGAETNCFPDADLAPRHKDAGTRFRYVNSGFMFGETEKWKLFLEEMNPEQYLDDGETDANLHIVVGNDQHTVMRMHLDGKTVKTQLDNHAHMVCNLCGLVPGDLVDLGNGIMVKETRTYPVCLHTNGPGKEQFHQPILDFLKL